MLHEFLNPDTLHDSASTLAHLLIQVQRGNPRLERLLHPVPAAEALRKLTAVAGHLRLDQGPDQEFSLDELGVLPVVGRAGVLSCSFRRHRSKL